MEDVQEEKTHGGSKVPVPQSIQRESKSSQSWVEDHGILAGESTFDKG